MSKLFIGLSKKTRKNVLWAIGLGFILSLAAGASNAWAQQTLTKSFNPAVIGTGIVSTLTFTITNNDEVNALTDVEFTDVLPTPAGLIIATPSNSSTTCNFGSVGSLDAPDGGGTITFTGGHLGQSSNCTITVDVTSATVGTHTNTTSVLTSSAPDSDPATADLNVVDDLPTITKAFGPNPIGPGSVSMLTFTLTNTSSVFPVTGLAFTDILPANVIIATPANASTTCNFELGGSLDTPVGGTTITFAGGQLGASGMCTVVVNVTSGTVGTHMNTSSDLTSDFGISGPATADLNVVATLPGFSKSFAPNAINFGGKSTLTFTIDNDEPGSVVSGFLLFTDNLPVGIEVANPSNAVNTCDGTLTAVGGTTVIDLFGGSVASGATCAVTVDVVGTGIGTLGNITGNLLNSGVSIGKASDTLRVNVSELALQKAFTNHPVPPGGTVELEFTINNLNRDFKATDIEFTDDLSFLTDLTPTGLPQNDSCGLGSLLELIGTELTFTGGDIPAEGSCSFSVTLDVPALAVDGTFTNTSSMITGEINGTGETGNPAEDDLFVESFPLLTKEFLNAVTMAPDPVVSPGDDIILRFTITNTSPTFDAMDIAFVDELPVQLPTASMTPAAGFCGPLSTATFTALINIPENPVIPATIVISDAKLGMGESCSFDFKLDVPADIPTGIFVNTSGEITAEVDSKTLTGPPATDSFEVVAPPDLAKTFTDDPVVPGGTVTLEFTISHSEESTLPAMDIAFEDDLDAALADLAATGLPLEDICGPGSSLIGTVDNTFLTFADGSLSPGESCTFSVTLDVPAAAAAGNHTNTTSNITATIGELDVTGNAATDDLQIQGLMLTKEFIDDPVIPGGSVTLRFTIDNADPVADFTAIGFTDEIGLILDGLSAVCLPLADVCGDGSELVEFDPPDPPSPFPPNPPRLEFTGGSLLAGESCTFDVELEVPVGTTSDTYINTTKSFIAINGGFMFFNNATDALVVNSKLLELTKEFTDDPVLAGDLVTLEFTLKNLDTGNEASLIKFDDDLDATLTGLVATALPDPGDACNSSGTLAQNTPGLLEFTGGILAPGAECTFSATLQIPVAAVAEVYPDTTTDVEGEITDLPVNGDPAIDDLVINALTFTKVFEEDTVDAGSTIMLTFTLTNENASSGIADLDFNDNLNATLPGLSVIGALPVEPCGDVSEIAVDEDQLLTFTGGSLEPEESCTFDVELLVPDTAPPGSFINTTSDLTQIGLFVAVPAIDTLTINPPPDVGDKIGVDVLFVFFNFITNQFQFDLAITNTNGGPIFIPLVVQFTSIETVPLGGTPVTVNNADFGGTGVGSGFNYSDAIGPDNKLDTGEQSGFKTWIFDDLGLENFIFEAKVLGSLVAPGSFAKTNIAQSFLFIVDINKGTVTIESIITNVEEPTPVEIQIPTDFALQQNYPNPFNPETSIRFQLPEAAEVTLNIYNLKGQLVRKLVNDRKQAGFHEITWNAKDNAGNNMPSGVYLYRIQAGAFTDVKKLTVLR